MGTTKRNLLKRLSIFPLITSVFTKDTYGKKLFERNQEPTCLFWIKTKGKKVKRTKPKERRIHK